MLWKFTYFRGGKDCMHSFGTGKPSCKGITYKTEDYGRDNIEMDVKPQKDRL
jgi:hypothetical protein